MKQIKQNFKDDTENLKSEVQEVNQSFNYESPAALIDMIFYFDKVDKAGSSCKSPLFWAKDCLRGLQNCDSSVNVDNLDNMV